MLGKPADEWRPLRARVGQRRPSAEQPDAIDLRRRLRDGSERPRTHRAAEKDDELSPPQMIEPHLPPLVRGTHYILRERQVSVRGACKRLGEESPLLALCHE
jgi:hypothetical protein